jgi:hypothetical protein
MRSLEIYLSLDLMKIWFRGIDRKSLTIQPLKQYEYNTGVFIVVD